MGIYNVLLLAVATLLVSCNAASTATSQNLVQSGDSVPNETRGNRFLRSNKVADENEAAADDEERSISITAIRKALGLYKTNLKPETFSKMMSDQALKTKMFNKWDKYKIPWEKVKEKMYLDYNPHYRTLLNEYMNMHIKPAVQKAEDVVKKAGDAQRKNTVTWDLTKNKVDGKLVNNAAAAV